jgi:hypothetical protein
MYQTDCSIQNALFDKGYQILRTTNDGLWVSAGKIASGSTTNCGKVCSQCIFCLADIVQRLTLQDSPCKLIPPPALMQTWGIVLNDYTQSVRTKQQLETYSAANVEKPIGRFSESGYRSLPQTRYRAKSAVKSFKYLSSLFRVAINLSFSLSIGAGAFSISPSLRFQFVSDLGSSLPWLIRQQLFNDRASNKSCALIFENSVDDCIYQLQQAFTDGKATPSDAYYSEFDDTRVISIVDVSILQPLSHYQS